MSKKELIIFFLILIAMASRFLFIVDGQSLIPNFTAVGAIAILGAAHLKGFKKWIIPMVVLWMSDLILNNLVYAEYYEHFMIFGSLWVYGSIVVIGILAYYLMKKASWSRLLVTSLAGGVLFYLITNAGVWISPQSPYSKDLSGLMQSYTAAIPFFRNTLLGNVFYSFVLFGAYEYLATKIHYLEPLLLRKQSA